MTRRSSPWWSCEGPFAEATWQINGWPSPRQSTDYPRRFFVAEAATLSPLLCERRPVDRAAHVTVAEVRACRTVLLVLLLHACEAVAVGAEVAALADVVVVEFGVGAAEDRGLDRTVSRAERLEAVLLQHVFGDFETAQCFDLPLRRAGPHCVSAPH